MNQLPIPFPPIALAWDATHTLRVRPLVDFVPIQLVVLHASAPFYSLQALSFGGENIFTAGPMPAEAYTATAFPHRFTRRTYQRGTEVVLTVRAIKKPKQAPPSLGSWRSVRRWLTQWFTERGKQTRALNHAPELRVMLLAEVER